MKNKIQAISVLALTVTVLFLSCQPKPFSNVPNTSAMLIKIKIINDTTEDISCKSNRVIIPGQLLDNTQDIFSDLDHYRRCLEISGSINDYNEIEFSSGTIGLNDDTSCQTWSSPSYNSYLISFNIKIKFNDEVEKQLIVWPKDYYPAQNTVIDDLGYYFAYDKRIHPVYPDIDPTRKSFFFSDYKSSKIYYGPFTKYSITITVKGSEDITVDYAPDNTTDQLYFPEGWGIFEWDL